MCLAVSALTWFLHPCQDVIRDWQQAASDVLVAVGQRFVNKVMEEVLTKFQPGILPHYFVVQTFANLSVSNGELSACGACVAAAALPRGEPRKRWALRVLGFAPYPNSSAASAAPSQPARRGTEQTARRPTAWAWGSETMESFRLAETSEITKSSCHPNPPMPAEPCPQGPHPDGF